MESAGAVASVVGQRCGDPGWTDVDVERRKRDEARNTARLGIRQTRDFVRNEWMAATATERRLRGPPGQVSTRGQGSTTPSSVCARSASSGSAMSIREPRLTPCACSCRQFFEYELGASGAALVVRIAISALLLRNQWLSRNLCDTFCPASLPVSLSNLLAHCDSSMAAIFGALGLDPQPTSPACPAAAVPAI